MYSIGTPGIAMPGYGIRYPKSPRCLSILLRRGEQMSDDSVRKHTLSLD